MTAKKTTKRASKRTAKKATKPQPSMAARIAELETMTTDQLRRKYTDVFGEETRSRSATHLRKRIAWRMQANEEGGVSERAKSRAAELANDADVRTSAPKGKSATPRTRTANSSGGAHDPRVPISGTALTRTYKGRTITALVRDDGFEYEGTVYKSLSAIARAVTGTSWNGFTFFGLKSQQDGAAR